MIEQPIRTYRGAAFGISRAELVARVAGRVGNNGRPLCLWCEDELAARRRVWCGDRCANAFYDATTWRGLRSRIGRRDRGICAVCAIDCRALRRTYAALPKHRRAAFARLHEIPTRRLRKTWWDADHVVPIAEGGRHAESNLRTLCLRCHKAATRALATRRLAARASGAQAPVVHVPEIGVHGLGSQPG
ncbi:MAG: HNH endonuclease [Candidatus Eremiobacteraeota bacterium]|nr:HNH endonuclease [Candidatus Eremiobacteraeota bacterium]